MHYYLSFVSAKVFGSYPDKIAYPSLFFSILAIPLFFFFLREYFGKKTSLMLTALFSVSYILVNASRFSSNQNLVPFFVLIFLWGLLKIMNQPEKFRPGWSIILGIGLGVGIQMHTTCLVAMPLVALLVFLSLLKKKGQGNLEKLRSRPRYHNCLKCQSIVSELRTNFQNTASFFQGVERDTDHNPAKSLLYITACQVEANAHLVASLYDDDDCDDIADFSDDRWATWGAIILGIASLAFSLLGYYFLVSRFRQETSRERRNFLGLVIVFHAIAFLVLASVANYVHVVYFLILFFVPFVLLGILFEFLEKRYGFLGKKIVVAVFILLLACSIGRDTAKAISYSRGMEDNDENSTLAQVEAMSEYLLANVPSGTKEIYFSGGKDLAQRFSKPIKYFLNQEGIGMTSITTISRSQLSPDTPLFYISDDLDKIDKTEGEIISGHEILSKKRFSNQTIFTLKN